MMSNLVNDCMRSRKPLKRFLVWFAEPPDQLNCRFVFPWKACAQRLATSVHVSKAGGLISVDLGCRLQLHSRQRSSS